MGGGVSKGPDDVMEREGGLEGVREGGVDDGRDDICDREPAKAEARRPAGKAHALLGPPSLSAVAASCCSERATKEGSDQRAHSCFASSRLTGAVSVRGREETESRRESESDLPSGLREKERWPAREGAAADAGASPPAVAAATRSKEERGPVAAWPALVMRRSTTPIALTERGVIRGLSGSDSVDGTLAVAKSSLKLT